MALALIGKQDCHTEFVVSARDAPSLSLPPATPPHSPLSQWL